MSWIQLTHIDFRWDCVQMITKYISIREALQDSILPLEVVDIIISYDRFFLELCENVQNRLDNYIHALEHFFRIHYRETKYHNDAVKKIVLYLFGIENKYIIDNDVLHTFLSEMLQKMKTIMKISGYDMMKSLVHDKKMEIWITIMLYIFLIDNIL